MEGLYPGQHHRIITEGNPMNDTKNRPASFGVNAAPVADQIPNSQSIAVDVAPRPRSSPCCGGASVANTLTAKTADRVEIAYAGGAAAWVVDDPLAAFLSLKEWAEDLGESMTATSLAALPDKMREFGRFEARGSDAEGEHKVTQTQAYGVWRGLEEWVKALGKSLGDTPI
jgi:hypothetical protein